MQWNPDPQEAVVIRFQGTFATGLAPSVAGLRSFRDSARNDIQAELAGWPAGPAFAPHSKGEQGARKAGRAFEVGASMVVNIAASVLGALGSPFSSEEVNDPPREPANEVEDFPVMWADAGTWARTVPWQLDPARRPKDYHVQVVLTDRRLVFLGGAYGTGPAQELHTIPRECLTRAEQMLYSSGKADARLTFFDGSWIRLATGNFNYGKRLVEYLDGTLRVLRADEITPAQSAAVGQWITQRAGATHPPYFTGLDDGYIRVDAPIAEKDGRLMSNGRYFDPQGNVGLPASMR